ncbi:MAG TPA: dihydroneopterin aldolase [candidate division Zixibacteria bacterium]|nr:dihydroneopterin aldolase [candidate division Zixibacteria bacterium]
MSGEHVSGSDGMDRITLRGMRFLGRHGVSDEERAEPQPIEVDVILRRDLSVAARSDDLADTTDYAAVFATVAAVVEGRSFRLLEALAGAIGRAVREAHDVDDVEVRVRKPKVPMPGAVESVEVRLRRADG